MNEEAPDLMVIPTSRNAGLVLAPDGSGWARYTSPAILDDMVVNLRFGRTADTDAFTIREIHLLGGALGTRSLREVRLAPLEAAVNRPSRRERLCALIAPTQKPAVPFPEDLTVEPQGWPWWMYGATRRKERAPSLRLRVPAGRPKPDDFYRQVAERFSYLTVVSPRPATDLAAANGVPVTTVHGWVKEARRRGMLPPGERGRTAAAAEAEVAE